MAIGVILAAAAFGTSAEVEQKLHKLSAGQIRAKFAGMELTDEVHWRELYAHNGTATSNSMGRKRTGKRRVEKDQLCIEQRDAQMLRGMDGGKKRGVMTRGPIAAKGCSSLRPTRERP